MKIPLTPEQVRAACQRLGITIKPTAYIKPQRKEHSTLNTPSQRSMICACGKKAVHQSGFGDECQDCLEARHRRYQRTTNYKNKKGVLP